MIINLSSLDKMAVQYRSGFKEEVLRVGRSLDSSRIELTEDQSRTVRSRYRLGLPKITGAGDAFAIIAQPFAKAIDAVAGTDIANCIPCAKRRTAWNKALPFKSPDS